MTHPTPTITRPQRPLRDDEQVTTLALSVLQLFSARKTLFEVARTTLQDAFDERFPGLGFNTADAAILEPAWPNNENAKPADGYRTDRLVDLLLERCRGVPARQYAAASHVSFEAGKAPARELRISVDEVLEMLDEWGPLLLQCYQQHLTQLWSGSEGDGASLWYRLGELLKNTLRRDCAQLNGEESATVQAVLDYPDSSLRERTLGAATTQAVITLIYEDGTQPARDDVMVLAMSRELSERTVTMIYTLSGGIELFDSTEAQENSWFGSGRSPGSRLRNYSPDGDIFEALTLCLLERQLQQIGAIKASDFVDLPSLERHLTQVCSPAALLGAFRSGHDARLTQLQAVLPAWLLEAPSQDRSAYSTLLASLAKVNRAGSYLKGIPTMIDYANQTLSALIMADDPARGEIHAHDFEITLQHNTNSDFEIIDPPFPPSRHQAQTQRFDQLALGNLDAFPYVPSRITYRGAKAPAWATYDYLRELTTRADIGKFYPALLQRELLDDPQGSLMRRRRFSASLRIMLPLQALELKIKHGLTQRAYQGVVAVLQPSLAGAGVAGLKVVVRPLAFQVRADAAADRVSNMFVLGPEDVSQGPHVLYRPTSDSPLIEYASFAELFEAIRQTGPLQDSVLAGLSAKAHATYANGGFHEPHTVRVIGGDFDSLRVPAPALLNSALMTGDVCGAMYEACAQALIAQAKKAAVSDAESRWMGFEQFGWAAFNVLLPLASGRVALVVLSGQLWVSVYDLIRSENGEAFWSACAEALNNLALLLIYRRPALRDSAALMGGLASEEKTVVDNAIHKISVHKGASSPRGVKEQLFYGWHSARSQFRAETLVNLDTFKMAKAPVGGAEVTTGQYRGLFRKGDQMFGCVNGSWFRVAARVEGVVIVHHAQLRRTGPWLKSDGQGHWNYETRLRLLGGGGPTVRVRRRVKSLTKKAQESLDGLPKLMADAQKMASSTHVAADVEDIIVLDAKKFEEQATELDQKTQTLGDEAPQMLIDQLNDGARQLRALARATRIQMLVARDPTSGAVEYLLAEKAISIRKVGGRQNFSAGTTADFMQEYEIRDADDKVLWYAHFHYLKKDAAALAFSKAHLKTVAQRKQGLAFQKAEQLAGKRVTPILRENISVAVARKLFAASGNG